MFFSAYKKINNLFIFYFFLVSSECSLLFGAQNASFPQETSECCFLLPANSWWQDGAGRQKIGDVEVGDVVLEVTTRRE